MRVVWELYSDLSLREVVAFDRALVMLLTEQQVDCWLQPRDARFCS